MLGFNEVKEKMEEIIENLAWLDKPVSEGEWTQSVEKEINGFWRRLKKESKMDIQYHLGLKKLESCPLSMIKMTHRRRTSAVKAGLVPAFK